MRHSDLESLKAQLAQSSSADLAALLASLAETEENVYCAATAFVQRKNPTKLIRTLSSQLKGLRTGKTFYTYKTVGGFQNKLWQFLDSIERNLVPEAPLKALDLLGRFIEADGEIFERADDSDGIIGDAYRHAADLFAGIAESLKYPNKAAEWFERLLKSNAYGARDRLFANASQILAPVQLEQLVQAQRSKLATRLAQTETGPHDDERRKMRVQLMQLAKASGNIDLYAEIALEGNAIQESPAYALEIAQLYLNKGDAEMALKYLPPFKQANWESDAKHLRSKALESLGQTDAASAILLDSFIAAPSARSALDYLNKLPTAEQPGAKDRLCRLTVLHSKSPITQAEILVALDRRDQAAQIICQSNDAVQSNSYYRLRDLAKTLEPDQPLAASLLYRGAVVQTLNEARPKNYRYAVGYLKKLLALEPSIINWQDTQPHALWWAQIYEKHQRKSSLVRELEKAKIQ